MPLTDQQRNALPLVRAYLRETFVPSTTAASLDQRARLPDRAKLPSDVTVRVEIATPSSHPSLLDNVPLRASEPVPVFFFAIHTDSAPADPANTHVIFFIHGGANLIGHPTDLPFMQFYVELLRAAARAGTPCILAAPSYRLATVPENAFPAALQDIANAYDHVIDQGYSPSNVVLAGDSAGGNHAIVLTHLLLRAGRPSPRGVVPIAPFSILAYDLMSEYAKAQASKDVIDVSQTDQVAKAYIGDSGLAPTDPLISGTFVPFGASWPKTLILVGTADQVIDGARVLAKRLTDAQKPVELVEYDERPHGWWVLPHIFSENIQDAAQRIAQFLTPSDSS